MPDWNSLDWGQGGALFMDDYGGVRDLARAMTQNNTHFAVTPENEALLRSLGYDGNLYAAGSDGQQTWSPDALQFLQNQGYSLGVGHEPGTSAGGRSEYWGLLGPDGKFAPGQSDPTMTRSDTFGDQLSMFAMLTPAIGGVIAAGGAGAGAAGGTAGLGAGGSDVAALGSSWSPEALGLTGGITPGVAPGTIAGLSEGIPGAVGAAGGIGAGAGLGGAGGSAAGAGPVSVGGGAPSGAGFGMSDATYSGLSDIPTSGIGTGTGIGSAGTWGQALGGILGLLQGQSIKDSAGAIDPFGPYRGGFAQMLSSLMQNPGMVTSMPGYKAGMQASEQALTRNLASQGLTGSGTAAQALTEFGARYQDTAFQQLFSQLSGLSGANFNNAGTALQGRVAGMQTQNDSLASLGKILPVLMNSFGG